MDIKMYFNTYNVIPKELLAEDLDYSRWSTGRCNSQVLIALRFFFFLKTWLSGTVHLLQNFLSDWHLVCFLSSTFLFKLTLHNMLSWPSARTEQNISEKAAKVKKKKVKTFRRAVVDNNKILKEKSASLDTKYQEFMKSVKLLQSTVHPCI